MIEIGIIKKTIVEANMEGENDCFMSDVEITEENDIQPVQIVSIAGIKSRPSVNNKAYIINLGSGFKVAIAIDDEIEPDLALLDGEIHFYANLNKVIKGQIHLLNDGSVKINNGTNHAVQYEELATQFNELKTKFNTLVSVYGGHVHSGVATGTSNTGPVSATGTTSNADITKTKIDTIKVP